MIVVMRESSTAFEEGMKVGIRLMIEVYGM